MKLLDLYSCLTDAEKSRLSTFLASPYFTKALIPLKIHDKLVVLSSRSMTEKNIKQELHKHLYKNSPYDDRKIRFHLSKLSQLVEQFLAIESLVESPVQTDLMCLKRLRRRTASKTKKALLKRVEKKLDEQLQRDEQHHLDRIQIEIERQNTHVGETGSKTRIIKSDLQRLSDQLDAYYLGEKLKNLCFIENRQNIAPSEYNIQLEQEILNWLKTHHNTSPAVAIYHKVLLTLKDHSNHEHYFDLKSLLLDHAQSFTVVEANNMYVYAQNYCIKRLNLGHVQFLDELFELYQTSIAQGILIQDEFLSPWQYKNIVSLGLRTRAYEWTRDFISSYKTKIDPAVRENVFAFNMAHYLFYQGQHQKVIELLHQVEYTDVFYLMDSKSLLIQSFFELDEIEALHSLLDSYEILLRRKSELPEAHRRRHRNLIRFVRKLTRIRPGNPEAVKKFSHQLNGTEAISNRNWLLEKAKQLG